jgi:phenolic acid decarboxylase
MPTPIFAGSSYSFQVDNGIELQDQYASDGRSLHWEAVQGPTKGQSETVDLHVAELSEGIYFVSWLESSGMTVSRVMDFNSGTAQTFWTMPADKGIGGRRAELHTATMRQLTRTA